MLYGFTKPPPAASCNCQIHDKGEWRREHLYCHEIDVVLGDQLAGLKAMFTCFQGKKLSNRKLDQLPLKNYMQMLKHCEFFDCDFTQREARLCYQLAKMKVADEVGSVDTFTYITFVDFMEAICRVAQMKNTPTEEDLQVRKKESIILLIV